MSGVGLAAGPLLPAVLAALAAAVLLGRAPDPRLLEALPPRTPAPRSLAPGGHRGPGRSVVPPSWVLAAAGAAVGEVASGTTLALVAGVGSVALGRAAVGRARAAADAAERAGALEACAVLAAELKAGRTPSSALHAAGAVAAGPLQHRLAAAASATGVGGEPAVALLTGPPTAVPQVAAGLGACWQVCSGTGGGLAAAVERLEDGLRHEAAARRAVEAELAGPRATAGMLALLPLGGIGLAAVLGAHPLHVLLQTRVGTVCTVAGVGLDLTGLAWTHRLARAARGD